MKPFQKLLLAPVALGLFSPLAATASELNLDGISKYAGPSTASSQSQVTSITQFSDVQPTEWAYQALSNLVEQYGCVAGYPDGTFRGNKPLSRWEAAALLNACLDRITEVTDELRRLLKEFESELAVLKGRVDGLEAKVGELEASQFSTTTKLQGDVRFTLGAVNATGDRNGTGAGAFGRVQTPAQARSNKASNNYNRAYGATTFSYNVNLNLLTSFTGKDLLYTRLRSGNFANAFLGNGLNLTALDYASNGFPSGNSDAVGIDRLYYTFPVGRDFTFTVGPRARNTEVLGVTPWVYARGQGVGVLENFTIWGAGGVYNRATGSLLAGTWKQNVKKGQGRFTFNASYVAPQGNVGAAFDGNPNAVSADEGGIGTDASRASFLAQLAYTAPQWSLSAAYRYGQAGSTGRRGTNFVASNSWWLANGESNNFAVNAYWQPKTSGIIPSINLGWGISNLSSNQRSGAAPTAIASSVDFPVYVNQSQSWAVGLQWDNVFGKGNSFGTAVGQPNFATGLSRGTNNNASTFVNDGNYAWEWWYKFQVTDNISVTPAIFYLSRPLGQQTDTVNTDGTINRSNTFSTLGFLVTTQFKF